MLGLGPLPVDKVHVKAALIEVDLEHDEAEFGSCYPAKEPIVLLKVLPISLVRGHEAIDSLLQLEEDKPVAHHEEDVPEVDRAEEVQQVDKARD